MMIQTQQVDQPNSKVEQQPKHDPIFQFKLDLSQDLSTTASKLLFIALHGAASIFLSCCLKPSSKIGHLNFQKSKQLALANIYSENSNLYVVFTDRFPPVHEVYLGEFLQARFAAERVVLLDTRSVALLEEKTLDLRYLRTTGWKEKTLGRLLTDNVVGIPADIIVHAEIHKKELVYYVGVLGDYELNAASLDVFKPLEQYDLKILNDPGPAIKNYNRKHFSNRIFL